MLRVHLLRVGCSFPDGPADSTLGPHTSLERLLALTDETTKRDVSKYRFLRDARRCLLGRLLARHVVTSRLSLPWQSVSFARSEKGRPYLVNDGASLDYNASHDSDLVAVASLADTVDDSSLKVGIDVMQIRNPWQGSSVDGFVEGIGEQLTSAERLSISRLKTEDAKVRHVLALWTLKEAFTKATGEGLHFDLQRLDFQLDVASSSSSPSNPAGRTLLDGRPAVGWRFSLVELSLPVSTGDGAEPYWLALAAQDPERGGTIEVLAERPEWMRDVLLEEVVAAAGCAAYQGCTAVPQKRGADQAWPSEIGENLGSENMPVEARGLFSGILQQGYAVGYLLAAVVNLTAVADHNDWRILFWFGCNASFFAAFVRFILPESQYFIDRQNAEEASDVQVSSGEKTRMFVKEAWRALKLRWVP